MTQNNHDIKIIGVTGITGSGTSTVSSILAELGGYVISADKLAHGVMRKGQPAYEKVLNAFVDCTPKPDSHKTPILHPNGEINRKALGAIVFGNPEKLAILESIIHPAVIAEIENLLTRARAHSFAVIDAPLLVESNLHKICHSVWLITAPDETRVSRITARDNIDRETVIRRIQSRKGDTFLQPYAHVVIENDSDLDLLREKVCANLELTQSRKEPPTP